jgi:hypothetical protein
VLEGKSMWEIPTSEWPPEVLQKVEAGESPTTGIDYVEGALSWTTGDQPSQPTQTSEWFLEAYIEDQIGQVALKASC